MNKIELNTARNCLRYIIKAFNIKEIFIPYYHCPSIRSAIIKENCKIYFYHLNKNFYPAVKLPSDAFILYTNYFGVCDEIVNLLSRKYKNIIIDNAHAFYSEPKGLASFNSLRKFFPTLQDGAFLYTQKTINENFFKDTHTYKLHSLNYEELCKNEDRLDKEDIKYISQNTKEYFLKINTEEDQEKRQKLFKILHEKLGAVNLLKLKEDYSYIPFGYPFLANNQNTADKLVKALIKKGICIFRYWNNLPDNYEEKLFYSNLVVISLNTLDPEYDISELTEGTANFLTS